LDGSRCGHCADTTVDASSTHAPIASRVPPRVMGQPRLENILRATRAGEARNSAQGR